METKEHIAEIKGLVAWLHTNGWNLYRAYEDQDWNYHVDWQKGPVHDPILGETYRLYPVTNKPHDQKTVEEELLKIGGIPSINGGNYWGEAGIFRFEEDCLELPQQGASVHFNEMRGLFEAHFGPCRNHGLELVISSFPDELPKEIHLS